MIKSAQFFSFYPTDRTEWRFVHIVDDADLDGWGECSFQGAGEALSLCLRRRLGTLHQSGLSPEQMLGEAPAPDSPYDAAAAAGINQALCDLVSRRQGTSVAALLGGQKREQIPLYANVNRGIADRSAEGFAAAARAAKSKGAIAVKIAPFDGVTPRECEKGLAHQSIAEGLERVAAVRDALGPLPLLIDCHWRFDPATGKRLVADLARFAPDWVECPVPETPDLFREIHEIRREANARQIRLAGGENVWSLAEVDAFLDADLYDVMMPDVKYTASLRTMLAMAETIRRAGVEFSPHNPTGPIAHAMSIEICAAVEQSGLLEYQHGETPLFDSIVGHALPPIEAGAVRPDPARQGLGLSLSQPELSSLPEAQASSISPAP